MTKQENEGTSAEYYWTTNEEHYGQGPFDSRENAVADAKAEGVGRFWTARKHTPTGVDFPIDAQTVLEQIGEQAYEMAGEAAEDWPGYHDDEDEKKLEHDLNAVLRRWIDEHDPPSFWLARDVEEHKEDE